LHPNMLPTINHSEQTGITALLLGKNLIHENDRANTYITVCLQYLNKSSSLRGRFTTDVV